MSEEFRPNDTAVMRLRARTRDDRSMRETVGNSTAVGGASVVLWIANAVGVDMSPDAAVVIGGTLSTVFSSLLRKWLAK